MNRRYPITLDPRPSFGLGWLCDHVRGAVQLPGEAAYEGSCQEWAGAQRPHAVVLAADWTDVEAARAYAEANGLDIVTIQGRAECEPQGTILVRTPPRF
jgi:hypothetical protein